MIVFSWDPSTKCIDHVFKSENVPESIVTGVLKDPGYADCCLSDDGRILWTCCKNGQIRAFNLLTKEPAPIVAVKPFAKPYPLTCLSLSTDSLAAGDNHGNSYQILRLADFLTNPKSPFIKKFKTSSSGSCLGIYDIDNLFVIVSLDGYVNVLLGSEVKLQIPISRLTCIGKPVTLSSHFDDVWDVLDK